MRNFAYNIVRSLHRPREWAASLIFGLLVTGTLYILRALIPVDLPYGERLATTLFIVLAVLILFPAREKILGIFLKKRQFSDFFGQDFHHFDFLARQFTMDALVHKITPELLDWLGVDAGHIAIMEPDRKHYLSYRVSNGVAKQDNAIRFKLFENSSRFLRKHSRAFLSDDNEIPEELRAIMNDLNAAALQPFVYQNSLLGFIILHSNPRNDYWAIALETFAGKAAISIKNYMLSMKVIDADQFEQELIIAAKIQKFLQSGKNPVWPGYEIVRNNHDFFPCVIEFFTLDSGKRYLTILASLRPAGASGILMFGVMGYLYSLIRRRADLGLRGLLRGLTQDPDLVHSEYRIEILTAEYREEKGELAVLTADTGFSVEPMSPEAKEVVCGDFHAKLRLYTLDRPLEFSFQGVPLLTIAPQSKIPVSSLDGLERTGHSVPSGANDH